MTQSHGSYRPIILANDLDPNLIGFINDSKLYKVKQWAPSSGSLSQTTDVDPAHLFNADVVSSEVRNNGVHRPVLDIDVPAFLVPSSTPGHSHLYIDKPMMWDEYAKLLGALEAAGIIEYGCYNIALKRKATMVRLPWIRK